MPGGRGRLAGRTRPWRMLRWGVWLFLTFVPVAAGAQDTAALKAEINQVYEKLLRDPSDLALNRRLIELGVALNDYDAAIGAVERLIFFQPDERGAAA